MFEVIPAIDVSAGRLARFVRGTVGPVDAFGGDPVAAARSFVEAGARTKEVLATIKEAGVEGVSAAIVPDLPGDEAEDRGRGGGVGRTVREQRRGSGVPGRPRFDLGKA